MNTTQENVPAITFHIETWDETALSRGMSVRATLFAEVQDMDMAKRVREKFAGGMKIYTVDDFKEKMIQVLKKDHKESEGRVVELENALLAKTREVIALKETIAQIRFSFSFLEGQ